MSLNKPPFEAGKFYKPKQFADFIGADHRTVKKMVATGQILGYPVLKSYNLPGQAILDYLGTAAQKVQTSSGGPGAEPIK